MMSINPQRGRAIVAVGLALIVVAACGGGSGGDADPSAAASESVPPSRDETSDPGATDVDSGGTDSATADSTTTSTSTSTSTTTTTVPVPVLAVASAALIEDNVDYRTGAEAEFATLSEPVDVAVGDSVRTDVTGYGEINYFEGSVTRLDVDTEFEVVALVDDPGSSEIRTRMGTGRTWHRVEQLAGDDVYEVETSVATATVRGTAFTITCPDETVCTFAVAEGVIELELPDGTIETLTAPSSVEVGPGGFGDIAALPFDGIFGDLWVFDNPDRDSVNGNDTAGAIYREHGPQYASLTGTYTGTLTPQPRSCDSPCFVWETIFELEVFDTSPLTRTFVLDLDCSNGLPCGGTGDIERSAGVETVPLTFDGTSLTFLESTETVEYCGIDDDGDLVYETDSGSATQTGEYRLSAANAEVIGGRWVATSLTGSFNYEVAIVDLGRCLEGPDVDSGLMFPESGGFSENTIIEMTRVP